MNDEPESTRVPDGNRTGRSLQRKARIGDARIADRLRHAVEGDVMFDAFSRGRYSTDASIYQVEPIGVVRPKLVDDIHAAIGIAREEGVPVLPRGAGTSQCGQTVGEAIVLDCSRYLTDVLDLDVEGRRARVRPGIVLDNLNRMLARHGLWFPIDPSTASRATIGGMAANNSSGARSLRYGMTVDNVSAIDAILADGTAHHFGWVPGNLAGGHATPGYLELVQRVREIWAREQGELARRVPKVMRHVAGYNLHRVDAAGHNMAEILIGSEGTLGFFTAIDLELAPLPVRKVLGVCHFPRFRDAMEATRHIVALGPDAVELVDRTIIELSRAMPQFEATVAEAVRGEPDALLIVEFTGDDDAALLTRLDELDDLMAQIGFPGGVVRAIDPAFQGRIWRVREAGLNIVMSMKQDGKPVSFIEDCAVPLEHLADFTERLTEAFHRHGTEGTWYAHASVGLLHVRPIINLKTEDGARQMRAIAEEAFDLVREYEGSHSGEHGDGFVRSEFHEAMLGPRVVRAFEQVKDAFDPGGTFNPGKIVRPPRMDDRDLFRFKHDYAGLPLETALDWSAWPGGFLGAVEMCNNNGTCRKPSPDVMCPSFRATEDEQHVTRGRANSLRLALTGQLGPDALTSDEMYETLDLCVGCKGCRRECPTGVDMARMKVEFLHHWRKRHGLSLRDRVIGYMPRYARLAARGAPLLNLRDRVPGAAWLSERWLGFSRRRSLPAWSGRPFRQAEPSGIGAPALAGDGRDVVLFADTFNAFFEPDNARAARRVLEAAGYRVHLPVTPDGRGACCGRTFLSVGLVDEAREEARRTLASFAPFVAAGVPVVGLEPACLLTLRDEFLALLPGDEAERLAAKAVLFEEFLASERAAGRLALDLRPLDRPRAVVHGHCHQKAFGAFQPALDVLKLVPDLDVEAIESSCCGMAGAFGYEVSHHDVSMRMAELSLLPAVRAAEDAVVVAAGTSCRHQIHDGAGREALHLARVLERALA